MWFGSACKGRADSSLTAFMTRSGSTLYYQMVTKL